MTPQRQPNRLAAGPPPIALIDERQNHIEVWRLRLWLQWLLISQRLQIW